MAFAGPDVGIACVAAVVVVPGVLVLVVVVIAVFGVFVFVLVLVVVLMVVVMTVSGVFVFVLVLMVVVMTVLGMLALVMVIIAMVVMGMAFEGAAFAERDMGKAVSLHEGHDTGLLTQGVDRPVQEGLQTRADPEDDVRILQCAGVRRTQAIGVWRAAALDDQDRGADPLHDAGDQRVYRFDRGDNGRRLCAPASANAPAKRYVRCNFISLVPWACASVYRVAPR